MRRTFPRETMTLTVDTPAPAWSNAFPAPPSIPHLARALLPSLLLSEPPLIAAGQTCFSISEHQWLFSLGHPLWSTVGLCFRACWSLSHLTCSFFKVEGPDSDSLILSAATSSPGASDGCGKPSPTLQEEIPREKIQLQKTLFS